MSFYGNMYLEFRKFFYNFSFAGSDIKNVTLLKDDDPQLLKTDKPIVMQPESDHATLKFGTGNRWIQFQTIDSGAKKPDGTPILNGIKIYHAPAGSDKEEGRDNISTLELYKDGALLQEDEFTVLEPGSYLETQVITYDDTGHYWKTKPQYFYLPISDIQGDITQLTKDVKELKDLEPEKQKIEQEQIRKDLGNSWYDTSSCFPASSVPPDNLDSIMKIIGPIYSSSSSSDRTVSHVIGTLIGQPDLSAISLSEAILYMTGVITELQVKNRNNERLIDDLYAKIDVPKPEIQQK